MAVHRFLFSFLVVFLSVTAVCIAEQAKSHNLVKRQSQPGRRSFPLSRSRQFPPPEELEEDGVGGDQPNDSEEETYDAPPPARRYTSNFRGRQQPPEEEEDENTSEEYLQTEAPATTTPLPAKAPNRISAFNRLANRPKFGSSLSSTAKPPASTRSRPTASAAQRIDVVADILNRPPPPRTPARNTPTSSKDNARAAVRKPAAQEATTPAPASRRSGTGRVRPRGRLRTRTSTTTTTTTTTTPPPPADEYYYYYYEDEEDGKQPIATTSTTTTTTTTAKPPSLPRRPSLNRGLRPSSARSASTARTPVKFDPESQFQPPPDDAPVTLPPRTTKKFTTSSTTTVAPDGSGIPPHLRSRYKPRTDGRFIDYLRDPNRPRELKGFDLTDYPFYIKVPEDIEFECDDKKDGYYASVPHHCQLFHYCFAGSRYDFLCANYTLYDQTTFTCRFANNVDCPSSEKYYYRNDDLWKETTTIPPQEQKKKPAVKDSDDDYEEDDYDDEDYYDDEEEEERRRRRPSRRRRNRRRKNRRKQSEE